MRAFEKIRGLVIWDWYFSGKMETISTKKKGNERKGCVFEVDQKYAACHKK